MNVENANTLKETEVVGIRDADTDAHGNAYRLTRNEKFKTSYRPNNYVTNESTEVPAQNALSCLSNIKFTGIIPVVADLATEPSLNAENTVM